METSPIYSPPRPADDFSSQSSTGTSSSLVDFDEFLNLFVTQLIYQDPLSPMDNSEFLAQTAAFSSVEQLVAINDSMAVLSSQLELYSQTNAASLLGTTVAALTVGDDGETIPVSGEVTQVQFGSSGELLLGLEDGTIVPFSNVLSIADAP
ncbi:MAG: flagellar hook capping protein [Deltaproteobacteria bacterium]|nr:flagellar hook capping protein [Deltaproteobacteria bacterium]